MYALVNGQELLLGPISFNYRMINSVLEEELEVDYRVTSQSYQSVPIIITEDIKILPTRDDNPEYDPRFESLSNITYEITETEVIFRHTKLEKPLEQIKDEYKQSVKPERQNKENQYITVSVQNTELTLLTSREQRTQLINKLTSLAETDTVLYKFNDNTWINVSKSDLEYVIKQIDLKVQEAFDWEYAKLQEIDSCQTWQEVYNVEISSPPYLAPPTPPSTLSR
jgi:hypothetical protein